jgi:hypothetical protein
LGYKKPPPNRLRDIAPETFPSPVFYPLQSVTRIQLVVLVRLPTHLVRIFHHGDVVCVLPPLERIPITFILEVMIVPLVETQSFAARSARRFRNKTTPNIPSVINNPPSRIGATQNIMIQRATSVSVMAFSFLNICKKRNYSDLSLRGGLLLACPDVFSGSRRLS